MFTVIAPRDDELADTARAFDQMADRIQHLVQKRQELLADISQELRSPLTRLSVSLELMRRGEADVLEQMQVDLDRMNAMIGPQAAQRPTLQEATRRRSPDQTGRVPIAPSQVVVPGTCTPRSRVRMDKPQCAPLNQ